MTDQELARIKGVKALFSDVDGVLTDGSIYVGPDNYELKRFTVDDGVGVAIARAAGLSLALISGRHSEATTSRAGQLKIEDVYQGYLNKLEPLELLLDKFGLTADEVAYVGDGLVDLPVLERVGVPVSVPNAPPWVRDRAMHVTQRAGGQGVLLEVVEWILTHQGRWDLVLSDMRKQIYMAD